MTGLTADMIRATGTPNFTNHFFRYWRALFPFRQLTGWHMAPGQAPVTLVAERPGEQEKVAGLCQLWVRQDYASDPVFAEAGSNAQISRLTLADIKDDEYRFRFFSDVGLASKLSLSQRRDNGTWYLNFYRFTGEPAYSDQEEQIVQDHLDIALACLEKHADILRDHQEEADDTDLFNTLSAFFRRHPVALSAREADCCAYAILGHTHESAGLNLGVSKSTAMTYRNRAYGKLGATGIPDLFTMYLAAQ